MLRRWRRHTALFRALQVREHGVVGKFVYCPLKSNLEENDSGGITPYNAMSALNWNEQGTHNAS